MLTFIGLGLSSFKDISLNSYEIIQNADVVLLDEYTNFVDKKGFNKFQETVDGDVRVVYRKFLEDNTQDIVNLAKTKKVALVIPGDPFVATTHVTIRILAEENRIPTKIIHNTSILSAVPSHLGLSAYKFGRTVTLPFPENKSFYPYDITAKNQQIGAHTLLLLDIDVENDRYLSIPEALNLLQELEQERQESVFSKDKVVAGIARLGSDDSFTKVGTLSDLEDEKWGCPPQIIVIYASLHFAEEEALKKLWHFSP
ncbi:MAG: diphthine synthase [Promethearchaeota archaeon]